MAQADRIVLPGVGAFGACAAALRGDRPAWSRRWTERVRDEGAPFLGICVGMQLMADAGEEMGAHAGLGWIARHASAGSSPADPDAQGAAHGLERRRARRRRTR